MSDWIRVTSKSKPDLKTKVKDGRPFVIQGSLCTYTRQFRGFRVAGSACAYT